MFEFMQITLTAIVCYGIYQIAYQRGYEHGNKIGFTHGLWKNSERKNLVVKPSIRKKAHSLID